MDVTVAICTYLADKHGQLTHTPGTPQRGRQDAMTQFCVDQVEGALWTASKNTFVHPEERRCPASYAASRFSASASSHICCILLDILAAAQAVADAFSPSLVRRKASTLP